MIETHDQHKQGNLANSAVLKMLEEEEGEKMYPGYKKVAWPPASDSSPLVKALSPQPQQHQQQQPHQQGGHYYHHPEPQSYPQYSQQQTNNNYEHQQYQKHPQQYQQQYTAPSPPQGVYYNQVSTHPQVQSQQQNPPKSSTVSFSGGIPAKERTYTPSHQPNVKYQNPMPQNPPSLQQHTQSSYSSYSSNTQYPENAPSTGWSHVRAPTPTKVGYPQAPFAQNQSVHSESYGSQYGAGEQQQYYQSSLPQQQPQSYHQQSPVVNRQQQQPGQYQQQQYYQPQSQYNQVDSQYYPQGQQQQPQQFYRQPSAERGQSPGIVTLRKEAPVTQKPSPVVQSQPAAKSFRGGVNTRGDLKWPPPEVKAQMDAENEERIRLTKSPPFRPLKVQKDYTQFFARHALNSTYPGYKVPPGTQHVYANY